MGTEVVSLADLTFHPGDRLVEDRCAGHAVMHGTAVQRPVFEHGGLGELHERTGLFAVPEVDRERATLTDQAMGDRRVVDPDADQHRFHRELRDPARGHAVAFAVRRGTDEGESVRDLPRDTVDEFVFEGHARRLEPASVLRRGGEPKQAISRGRDGRLRQQRPSPRRTTAVRRPR